jgi:hypothetical protein
VSSSTEEEVAPAARAGEVVVDAKRVESIAASGAERGSPLVLNAAKPTMVSKITIDHPATCKNL